MHKMTAKDMKAFKWPKEWKKELQKKLLQRAKLTLTDKRSEE